MWGLDPRMLRAAGRVSAVGIEIVVALVIGYHIGHWVDVRLGTAPYLTVFFTLVGLGAGIKALVRTSREFKRQLERDDDQPPEDEPPKS